MSFAPSFCPNSNCSQHHQPGGKFIKKGFYSIKRLKRKIRKYQCTHCKKVFSSRTFKPDYRHKKMDLNFKLAKLLVEGCSLRASSRILGLSYSNTYKKFLWLKTIIELKKRDLKYFAEKIQIDELETIHHTKCKPLSIALVANEKHELLSAQVAEFPAKGRLSEISIKKYGPRIDERTHKIQESLLEVKRSLQNKVKLIESDQNPRYGKMVRSVFGGVEYRQHNRAEKERVQARLHEKMQKKRFDPLFVINHQCARLRSQIKRLTRRSWCTTKKVENLQLHLDLFIVMQFYEKF